MENFREFRGSSRVNGNIILVKRSENRCRTLVTTWRYPLKVMCTDPNSVTPSPHTQPESSPHKCAPRNKPATPALAGTQSRHGADRPLPTPEDNCSQQRGQDGDSATEVSHDSDNSWYNQNQHRPVTGQVWEQCMAAPCTAFRGWGHTL